MKRHTLFKKILKDNNFSSTAARSLIFDLLAGASEPQSMHQLIEGSKGKVDRVSVYRTIELFERLGIVQRLHIGWKYKLELSEMFLDHHHHMTCLGCGCVVPIKDETALEETIERLGKANNFVLKSHQLEIQGYCKTCQVDAI
jgi:Fur family transcriptional regulator, ferric uptake regulator